MEKLLKKVKINNAIAAILGILMGVIFILFRQSVADLVTRVIGVLLLVAGAIFVLSWLLRKERTAYELSFLILGALMVVPGLVILANPTWFESLVALILGIIILVSGIESVVSAMTLWKRDVRSWWIWLILALITVIAGLVLIVRRYEFSATLIMICGIILIYDGVTSLIVTARLAHAAKLIRQEMNAVDVEATVDGEVVTPARKPDVAKIEKK